MIEVSLSVYEKITETNEPQGIMVILQHNNYNLKEFSKVWLEITAFNTQQANDLLNKNKAIQIRLEVDKLNKKTITFFFCRTYRQTLKLKFR